MHHSTQVCHCQCHLGDCTLTIRLRSPCRSLATALLPPTTTRARDVPAPTAVNVSVTRGVLLYGCQHRSGGRTALARSLHEQHDEPS